MIARALDRIEQIRVEEIATVWRLDAESVLSRLAELVLDPSKVSQSSLHLCGPAAFLMLWLKRDPLAVVEFTRELLAGSAHIGSLLIKPRRQLLQRNYSALKIKCPAADWMILSSIRDSSNKVLSFRGMPADATSGITFPSEIVRWLRATNIYTRISNETNTSLRRVPMEQAKSLHPNSDTDIILLISKRMFNARENPILDRLPNHYVVLTSDIAETPEGKIDFTAWSWGGKYPQQPIEKADFERNYFGAIVATI